MVNFQTTNIRSNKNLTVFTNTTIANKITPIAQTSTLESIFLVFLSIISGGI